MTHKDPAPVTHPDDDVHHPGTTEYPPAGEPKPDDIYVPDGGEPPSGPSSPSEH